MNKEDTRQQESHFDESEVYYEDELQYVYYSETEAEEIVIPVDEELQTESENSEQSAVSQKSRQRLSFRVLLKRLLKGLIDMIFLTGDNTLALIGFLFRVLSPLVVIPLSLAARRGIALLKSIRHFILHSPRSLVTVIRSTALERKERKGQEKPSYIGAIISLIFSERRLLRAFINLAFPLAAILAVISFYSYFENTVSALEVYYNGVRVGYIKNESVFDEALEKADSLLALSQEDEEGLSRPGEPTYKLARVTLNELDNADSVSESIIACSGISYVRACGIYIDGDLLCAVKNESDAVTVFQAILEPYRAREGDGGSVAFVEEIEYVQGLYPQSSELIWDSMELRSALTSPKKEAVVHTLKPTDTIKGIYTRYGITYQQLVALNPGVDLSKPEEISKLTVAKQENYVRVKVMKTRVLTEEMPYETIEKNSSSLSKGTKKTSQQGVNGKREITQLVTYIDGSPTYATTVSEKVIKKPVNEIILIGTSSPTSSSSWCWPTKGAYSISSNYGYRNPSISGWGFHGGIDIVVGGRSSSGIPVVAACAGTVEKVQKSYSGYGYMVLINHGNGIKTRYAHMLAGSITVYTGQKVSKGQQIGKIGSTGNSTGPHLHFEVIVNGSKTNPLKYVRR